MDPQDHSTIEKLHSALDGLTQMHTAAINMDLWRDIANLKVTVRDGQAALKKIEQGIDKVQGAKANLEKAKLDIQAQKTTVDNSVENL